MSSPEARAIVVFGDDWGRHVSSMQHLFREVVEHRTVIWVNSIGHRVPRLRARDMRRAWEKSVAMLRPRAPSHASSAFDGRAPAVVVEPRVLPWHDRDAVTRFNAWSLLRSLREALRKTGSGNTPILVTGSPPSAPVVGRLGEVASVYFCMDDFLHLAGVSPGMLGQLERRLLDKVDAVIATARSLTWSKRPRSGRAYYLPQGVNYEHFASARPVPADMAKLPRPIIGFAGGVSRCCDLALIGRLAERFSGASIVLVGPASVDTASLARPNVHILGPRPYADLPAYVQCFDVGLIPYLLNEWTRAVDPLKLLEYLAAGVPVVSTPIPEASKYREAVRIASDPEAFVAAVSTALDATPTDVERGRRLAGGHTWRMRARRFLEILDSLAERWAAGLKVAM